VVRLNQIDHLYFPNIKIGKITATIRNFANCLFIPRAYSGACDQRYVETISIVFSLQLSPFTFVLSSRKSLSDQRKNAPILLPQFGLELLLLPLLTFGRLGAELQAPLPLPCQLPFRDFGDFLLLIVDSRVCRSDCT